jgi:peptidoglycan-associated lipoprotein
MVTLVRAAIVGIGISLLAGCGSAQGEASLVPGRSTAGAGWKGDRQTFYSDRQDSRGAKLGGDAKDRSLSVTGVNIDPSLLSACGIPSANAFFEFDSAQVKTDDQNTLHLVAQCLASGPLMGQKVEIVGHTDPRGTDEYNYQLGKSRAQSVSEYLSGRGVGAGNVSVTSYGESMSSATDERGWAYERRVDIRLAK